MSVRVADLSLLVFGQPVTEKVPEGRFLISSASSTLWAIFSDETYTSVQHLPPLTEAVKLAQQSVISTISTLSTENYSKIFNFP